MADSKFKLSEINREYSTFRSNQVLTAEQLNRFIRYLDGQQRLSRVLLNGVGIVCGLKLKYEPDEIKVDLTPGCGVTTDGDLLFTEETASYSYFRKFTDDNARYTLFRSGEEQIDLWELRSDKENGNLELGDFPADSTSDSKLSDMVVLLYLESFSREPDLCTTLDCDNLGIQKLARQRLLLVHKDDVDTIIQSNDSLARSFNTPLPELYKLPRLRLKRPLLNKDNTEKPEKLHEAYREAFKDTQEQINGSLRTLHRKYRDLLDPDEETDSDNWTVSWYRPGNDSYEPYFQYRYDAVKDIVNTYEELRALLLDITVQCMPSFDAFPRHLMLGQLPTPEDPARSKYRHLFYPSPVHEKKEHTLSKAKNLFRRIDALLTSYRVPEPDDDPESIRITPAPGKTNAPLSDHPIPFYYKPLDVFRHWNYEKNRYYKNTAIHSYHARVILDHAAPDHYGAMEKDEIVRPLNYDIDNFDFFRIEGHQGRYWHEVMERLISLKNRKNLPFDIIALKTGDIEADIEDYDCHFEDLKAILKAWETELQCKLANITRFFSGINLQDKTFAKTAAKDTYVYGSRYTKEYYYSEKEGSKTVKGTTTGTVSHDSKDTLSSGSKIEQLQGQQQYYETDYTVIGNLQVSENSLGSFLDTAYKNTPERCAGDVEKDVKEQTQEYSFANDDERKLLMDIPLEVITLGNKVIQQKPVSVVDFKDDRLNAFRDSLQQLCSKIDKIINYVYQFVTQPLWDDPATVQTYLDQLRNLKSICCSEEKIREIRDQLEERKKEILKRTILSEFIQHQSGLEHLAGVPRGGTFVIVYKDRESTLPNVMPGTVIADFSLPYVCCSDCPPVNYILPPKRVSLRLNKGFVCLVKDSEPEKLPFEVYPRDAIIKAKPDKADKAIVREDERYWFDPGKFDLEEDQDLLGKTITFTVNDQETETELVVYRKPEPDFSAETSKIEESDSLINQYKIAFDNRTIEKSGEEFEYVWFVDGEEYYTGKNPEPLIVGIEWGEDRVVTIRLKVINGKCEAIQEQKVEISSEEKVVLGTSKDHLCVDADSETDVIDFVDLHPADGKIRAIPEQADKAVIQKEDGTPQFDLNQLDAGDMESLMGKTITFTVNDKETDASISVYRRPRPNFNHERSTVTKDDVTYFKIEFQNLTPVKEGDDFTYRWVVGDKIYHDLNPVHLAKPEQDFSLNLPVKLTVKNVKCEASHSETITVDPIIVETNECIDQSVEWIGKFQEQLKDIDPASLQEMGINSGIIDDFASILQSILDEPEKHLQEEGIKSTASKLMEIESVLRNFHMDVGEELLKVFIQLYELVTAASFTTLRCLSFDITREEMEERGLDNLLQWLTALPKYLYKLHQYIPFDEEGLLLSLINEIIEQDDGSRPTFITNLKELRDMLISN